MLLFAYFSSSSGHSISSCYLSCSLGSRYLPREPRHGPFSGYFQRFVYTREGGNDQRCVSDLDVTIGVWVFRFLNDEVSFEENT